MLGEQDGPVEDMRVRDWEHQAHQKPTMPSTTPTPPPTQLHVTGKPGEHGTEPSPEVPEPRRTAHLPSSLPA